MKISVEIKKRSHRYEINKTRLWHGKEYAKYKMCFSRMIVKCNK